MPEPVTAAMGEIAADVRDGLLAMAIGTRLQVMAAMMDADVTAVRGPKGKHDPGRRAVRHGAEKGSVTLRGRRVPICRRGCAAGTCTSPPLGARSTSMSPKKMSAPPARMSP